VRPLYSIFFKYNYKEGGTLSRVSFDTMSCMDVIESLILYYSHKIPLSIVILSYGTRYNAKEWNPLSS
jgi:hypothetical protein